MSVSAVLAQAAYLADDTDVGDETHKAGPIAILVIIVLCVACFLLFRSMSKHMRRVREQFPDEQPEAGEPEAFEAGVVEPGRAAAAAPEGTVRAARAVTRATPKSRPRDDSAAR